MSRLFLSRVFVRFAVLCVVVLIAFFVYSLSIGRSMSFDAVVRGLDKSALTARGAAATLMAQGRSEALSTLTRDMARDAHVRITLIDARGLVLADSEEDPQKMENHSLRPEVAAALVGETGISSRLSSTVRRWTVYVAVPVVAKGIVQGVVRASSPRVELEATYPKETTDLLLFVGPMLLVCLLFALAFTRSILSPLRDLTGAVARFASGDFGARLHLRRHDEIRQLAEAFNGMGERVQALFQDSARRTQELDGIFSSVEEGIVLLDRNGRIVRCNRGFEVLAGTAGVEGKTLWELVRAPRLIELVQEARSTGERRSEEVACGEGWLLCTVQRMAGRDELIVVLHDTSDIRRLETVKRDFVVNASHELRTPLTSISGSLEMLEGQLSGDSERWVDTIRRNAERMSAIVEDLLLLSSLEAHGVERSREPVTVGRIVADAAGMFANRAQTRGIALTVSVPDSIPSISADPFLIEQMLVNLLDNALKFTETGEVHVSVSSEDGSVRIEVSDTGIGIAEEHIPRLFERFYVVDKSRSRKLGGTGLGLSIVKHIVQSHGGTVTVQSVLGRGTRFVVHLPVGSHVEHPDGARSSLEN
ncbi:MAG TPA: ATP-binding protein [Spirochaetia bacterium]|nr:ATP-binding protein [Spirochaetia bacterium]